MTHASDAADLKAGLRFLAAAPAIWAAHFMLSYVTAAVWCAKAGGPDASLTGVRLAIAGYTVLALLGVGVVGRRAHRHQRHADPPHEADTPESRQGFLGFASLLLSGLSAIAILYAALAAAVMETCR